MSRTPVLPAWSAPARPIREATLARLAARGDARAFEAIFRRHHQELYRYCSAILSDPHDAQDALQATMAAALRALPGERREIALRPWLFRVAHNEAISIARIRREAPLEADLSIAPGADVDAEARERLRTLVGDLNSLPERQRGALVMRELSGLSYADVGAALGASEAAARQIVYEAREAMRDVVQARDADCGEIRMQISAGDGRVLRGRKVRAHLRSCESCGDYRAAISQRQADMRMLAPPLPAAAATGLLAAIAGEGGKAGLAAGLGSTGAGTGIGGALGGIGGVTGASAVAKGGAVIAALALGTGAATVTGAVELPLQGPPDSVPVAEQASPRAQEATSTAQAVLSELPGGPAATAQGERGGEGGEGGASARTDAERGHPGDSAGPAHAESPSGIGRRPEAVTPPPEQAVAPGVPPTAGTGTGYAGGTSAATPAEAAPPPSAEGGKANSNAGAAEPPDQAFGQASPKG